MTARTQHGQDRTASGPVRPLFDWKMDLPLAAHTSDGATVASGSLENMKSRMLLIVGNRPQRSSSQGRPTGAAKRACPLTAAPAEGTAPRKQKNRHSNRTAPCFARFPYSNLRLLRSNPGRGDRMKARLGFPGCILLRIRRRHSCDTSSDAMFTSGTRSL